MPSLTDLGEDLKLSGITIKKYGNLEIGPLYYQTMIWISQSKFKKCITLIKPSGDNCRISDFPFPASSFLMPLAVALKALFLSLLMFSSAVRRKGLSSIFSITKGLRAGSSLLASSTASLKQNTKHKENSLINYHFKSFFLSKAIIFTIRIVDIKIHPWATL